MMMPGGCCGAKKQKLASVVNGACCNGESADDSCCKQNGDRCADFRNGFCNGDSCAYGSATCASATGLANGVRMGLLGQKPLRFATLEMVIFCFDVLHSYLHNYEPPKAPRFPNEQFPLFVTWKIGKEKKLRGCIGTFTSTSLHQGLREYSVTSACKDSRFDPITAEDFSRLHCSISLLLDFEVADHYLDWQIGMHGIRIEFNNEKGSKKAATYLPEVSVEQGWNHIQTIDSLLRKGGFKGSITPEVRTGVCLVRFQSEKIGASYSEYVSFKKTGSFNGLCGGGCDPPPPIGIMAPPINAVNGQSSSSRAANGYHALFGGGGGRSRQLQYSNHAHHHSGGGAASSSTLGRALVGGSPRSSNASRYNAPPYNHPYRP